MASKYPVLRTLASKVRDAYKGQRYDILMILREDLRNQSARFARTTEWMTDAFIIDSFIEIAIRTEGKLSSARILLSYQLDTLIPHEKYTIPDNIILGYN